MGCVAALALTPFSALMVLQPGCTAPCHRRLCWKFFVWFLLGKAKGNGEVLQVSRQRQMWKQRAENRGCRTVSLPGPSGCVDPPVSQHPCLVS